MELLIIWFVFGLITALVASNKGLSGCGWFVLGVLLGPLGLILALVMPKNERAVEQHALDRQERKKCPYCAELIKKEAIKCRFCASDLTSSQGRRPQTKGPVLEDLRSRGDNAVIVGCPECGTTDKISTEYLHHPTVYSAFEAVSEASGKTLILTCRQCNTECVFDTEVIGM